MSFVPLEDVLGEQASRRPAPLAGGFDGEHVLVPLLAPGSPVVADQVRVATTLARASDAALSVVKPIDGPPPADGGAAEATGMLDLVQAGDPEAAGRLDGQFYTRDVVGGVLAAVRGGDVDTLVLPSDAGGRVRRGVVGRIAAHADADVVVVNGRAGYDGVASVLLPVAGGPHSGLAVDVARAVAADCDAWVDALHVLPEDAGRRRRAEAERLLSEAYHRIERPETTTTWLLESDDVGATIAEQSRYYELTVLGAPTKGRLRRLIHGSTNRSVRAGASSAVLSTHSNG